MSTFEKAVRTQRRLKGCLIGPSGSGKTYTALQIAKRFAEGTKGIAVIDTERSSASLYAGRFDFDTVSLNSYSVNDYIAMIVEADKAGYGVLIIDSLSHAWEGKGGILDEVRVIAKRKGYKTDIQAWGDVKPIENKLWDAMLECQCAVIATMRTKTHYEISNDNGKIKIEKLGLAPIQRADKEYEFDFVGRMEMDNTLVVLKTRFPELNEAGGVFPEPNGDLSTLLWDALHRGVIPTAKLPESRHLAELLNPMTDPVSGDAQDLPQAVVDAFDAKGIGGGEMERWIARAVDVRMTNQELLDHIGTYTPRGKAKAAAKRNLTTEPDMEPEREPGDEPIEDGAQQELPA